MSQIILCVLGAILGCFSLLIIVGNYGFLYSSWRRHHFSSMIPFLGGLAGVAFLVVLPSKGTVRFWWIPLLLDPSIPLFLAAIPLSLRDAIQPRSYCCEGGTILYCVGKTRQTLVTVDDIQSVTTDEHGLVILTRGTPTEIVRIRTNIRGADEVRQLLIAHGLFGR